MNYDKKRRRQASRLVKTKMYGVYLADNGKSKNLRPYVFMKKMTWEEFAENYNSTLVDEDLE